MNRVMSLAFAVLAMAALPGWSPLAHANTLQRTAGQVQMEHNGTKEPSVPRVTVPACTATSQACSDMFISPGESVTPLVLPPFVEPCDSPGSVTDDRASIAANKPGHLHDLGEPPRCQIAGEGDHL